MKITAIDWLIDEIILHQQKGLKLSKEFDKLLISKAKEIERDQIIQTWYDCKLSIINKDPKTADQYFNKKYK